MKMRDESNVIDSLLGMENPPLPAPKQPSKCPLFCCFYAEFDIKVGPRICFQSPRNFMDQDINISTDRIHEILTKTFEKYESPTTNADDGASNEDGESSNPVREEKEEEKSSLLLEGSLSIFDSTSEYIITGSELTGKIITLSTHDMVCKRLLVSSQSGDMFFSNSVPFLSIHW